MRRRRSEVQAIAAAVVLTLGSGVWSAVSLPERDVAPETLTAVSDATVIAADGGRHVARDGERLAVGDTLSTGAAGRATLLSPGRRLLLAAASEVTVGTGSPSYDVRSGAVGFEVRRGGAALLRAGAVTVRTTSTPAVVRIDRAASVRVASLRGGLGLSVPAGATVSLGDLGEVRVPGVSLPAAGLPLSVVDTSPQGLDAALAPALVAAQVLLDRLAAQVDADPLAPAVLGAGSPGPASEVALPRAIGAVARVEGSVEAKVARAVALRAAGAEWSVVAAQLQAPPDEVRTVLATLLTPGQVAQPGVVLPSTLPSAAASSPASPGPSGPGRPTPSRGRPTPTPAGGGASPSAASPTRPGATPSPTPGSSPSPSPSGNPGLVGGLLGTVGGLLFPSPSPSPSR